MLRVNKNFEQNLQIFQKFVSQTVFIIHFCTIKKTINLNYNDQKIINKRCDNERRPAVSFCNQNEASSN